MIGTCLFSLLFASDRAQQKPKELSGKAVNRLPTGFSGDLDEGLHAALAVVPLRGQRGHVVPAHCRDDVNHGLGLVGVRRHHAGEKVVAAVVAQLRSRGGVADLGDLEKEGKLLRRFVSAMSQKQNGD